MKTVKYILSFAALGVAMMSCQKDSSESLSVDNGTKVTITGETGSAPVTKSSIDGLNFAWATLDALSVNNTTTQNAKFDIGTPGSAKGDFTGALDVTSAQVVYAAYPYVNNATRFVDDSGEKKYTFYLAESQTQNHNEGVIDIESLGKHSYMTGKTAMEVQDASTISLKMAQVMALFDFNITGISGKKVHTLVLRSSADVFATSAKASFTADGTTPTASLGTSRCDRIEVKLTETEVRGVVAGEDFKVRMVMFPQTFDAGAKWYVDVLTSEVGVTPLQGYTFEVPRSKNIYEGGKRYNVAVPLSGEPAELGDALIYRTGLEIGSQVLVEGHASKPNVFSLFSIKDLKTYKLSQCLVSNEASANVDFKLWVQGNITSCRLYSIATGKNDLYKVTVSGAQKSIEDMTVRNATTFLRDNAIDFDAATDTTISAIDASTINKMNIGEGGNAPGLAVDDVIVFKTAATSSYGAVAKVGLIKITAITRLPGESGDMDSNTQRALMVFDMKVQK